MSDVKNPPIKKPEPKAEMSIDVHIHPGSASLSSHCLSHDAANFVRGNRIFFETLHEYSNSDLPQIIFGKLSSLYDLDEVMEYMSKGAVSALVTYHHH